MKILKLAQMVKGLYEGPVLGEMDSKRGKATENPVTDSIGRFVKRKVKERALRMGRKYIHGFRDRIPIAYDYFSNRAGDLYVRNIVRNFLSDKYGDVRIHDVPLADLRKRGAVAMEYRGDIYTPRISDIPGMFGVDYRYVVKASGKNNFSFNRDVKNYLTLHEIGEYRYKSLYGIDELSDEDHARYEAILLKALRYLGGTGDERAEDIYKAGIAYHSMRDEADPFLKLTRKYDSEMGMDRIKFRRDVLGMAA